MNLKLKYPILASIIQNRIDDTKGDGSRILDDTPLYLYKGELARIICDQKLVHRFTDVPQDSCIILIGLADTSLEAMETFAFHHDICGASVKVWANHGDSLTKRESIAAVREYIMEALA